MLKKVTVTTVFTAFSLLYLTSMAWAGAWTMPAGKLYTRVAYSEYEAQRYFNENGTSHNYAPNDAYKGKFREFDYDEQTWSLYAEYGLLDNLTLIGSFDYKETEWTYQSGGPKNVPIDKTARASGLADVNFGFRYRLLATQSGALAVQALYKSAEAYDEKDQDLSADIQLGDGQDDFEVRLQYGQSLYPLIPGYCNVEAGWRWRSQEYSDQFRYLIEVGFDLTQKLYLRSKLDGTESVGNGDDGREGKFTEVDSNPFEIDLGKLEVTLGYKLLPQLAIEANYSNELYGASTTKGETLSLALAATLF